MPNPNRNLDKEIAEGLARSERMIRRQRMINWTAVILALIAIFATLCCGAVGVLWLLNNLRT